jgi:hypothetical protein
VTAFRSPALAASFRKPPSQGRRFRPATSIAILNPLFGPLDPQLPASLAFACGAVPRCAPVAERSDSELLHRDRSSLPFGISPSGSNATYSAGSGSLP